MTRRGKLDSIKVGASVSMDAAVLTDTRMLIAGSSGSGKSYTMRVIAEQVVESIPTFILDPEGEYGSLAASLDVVVIGGDDGLQLSPDNAASIARSLLSMRCSAVVDMYSLNIRQRRMFVKNFLDSMMACPRSMWTPCVVMIDEAHKFCPERSSGSAESTDSVITLLSQGRKRGFCTIVATQRLAKLHKDAAAELLNVMIGRTSLDTDVNRARDILGMSKTDATGLRSASPGQWWGYGPAFQHDGVKGFKVSKAKTRHPTVGTRAVAVTARPSSKMAKVLSKLAESIGKSDDATTEQVASTSEADAKTIASLRETNRSLADKLHKKDDESRLVASRLLAMAKDIDSLREAVLSSAPMDARHARVPRDPPLVRMGGILTPPAEPPPRGRRASESPRGSSLPRTDRGKSATDGSPSRVTGGRARIMSALWCMYKSSGCAVNKKDLAVVSNFAPSSGTYSTYLGRLAKDGVINRGGIWLIPVVGEDEYEPVPFEGKALEDAVLSRLGASGVARIFEALIERRSSTRQELSESAGFSAGSGTFSTYLGRLKKSGYIRVTPQEVHLAEVFGE